jgi:RNAse H domain protein, YqgF family
MNMDGGSGERVALTLEFVEKLKSRVDVPIIMQDERLTTKEADEILDESGVKKQDRKQFIDQVAASIILKEYMEKENGQ